MARAEAEDPMVAKAFDANAHGELERAIKELSPEEAAYFLHKLESALRKRRIMLLGYLAAMLVGALSMIAALFVYTAEDGAIAYGIFLMPPFLVGLTMYVVGAYATRVGSRPPPPGAAIEPPAP